MIAELLQMIRLDVFKKRWRANNRHNATYAVNHFPKDYVTVGKHTYGPLKILWMTKQKASISIGQYVSIGPEVTFLIGGQHDYRRISTFPFQTKTYNQQTLNEAECKISVEDDVWIGYDALILSGVRIGRGSVIGARSIVTKDVPPYSIYVGNKIIKRRFPDDIIKKLDTIDFSSVEHQKGDLYEEYCQDRIDSDNLEMVMHAFING